jgi:predicted nucleic acid-binding protein
VTTVLDSWAVLGYLQDTSPAAEAVAALLQTERPLISWINLGEVFQLVRRAAGEDAATSTVRDLRNVVTAERPDERSVLQAGRIKSEFPLAFADAFAAATAQAHNAELWTGDPALLVQGAPWTWRDLR